MTDRVASCEHTVTIPSTYLLYTYNHSAHVQTGGCQTGILYKRRISQVDLPQGVVNSQTKINWLLFAMIFTILVRCSSKSFPTFRNEDEERPPSRRIVCAICVRWRVLPCWKPYRSIQGTRSQRVSCKGWKHLKWHWSGKDGMMCFFLTQVLGNVRKKSLLLDGFFFPNILQYSQTCVRRSHG